MLRTYIPCCIIKLFPCFEDFIVLLYYLLTLIFYKACRFWLETSEPISFWASETLLSLIFKALNFS